MLGIPLSWNTGYMLRKVFSTQTLTAPNLRLYTWCSNISHQVLNRNEQSVVIFKCSFLPMLIQFMENCRDFAYSFFWVAKDSLNNHNEMCQLSFNWSFPDLYWMTFYLALAEFLNTCCKMPSSWCKIWAEITENSHFFSCINFNFWWVLVKKCRSSIVNLLGANPSI